MFLKNYGNGEIMEVRPSVVRPKITESKPAVKVSESVRENKIHAGPVDRISPLDRSGGRGPLPAPARDGKVIDASAMLIENAKARARAAAAMRGEPDPFINEGSDLSGPASSTSAGSSLVANAMERARQVARATGKTLAKIQRF